ncbi:MAG: MBL fold metallo-hydrolase [Candidatus Aenigmarchaeota archaeon]|nr:MBL fold metallo-hydrolase [Candidatus Aenigmarchaeota archaeon]
MKVTFLGTGGGRHVVISQLRATGGFIVESGKLKMHVDPGPGALVRARQYRKDLKKLNCVFVSHAHPDHYTDLEMVLEAITLGTRKKRGLLVTNENVLKGSGEYRPIVSSYHLNSLEAYYALKPGESAKVPGAKLSATPCRHKEEKCIGFVLEDEFGVRLGYTADGAYYPGQEEYFKKCDGLIINSLRSRFAKNYGHMTTDGAKNLIEKARPKIAILQHLGMKMLFGVAEREAEWAEKETGIRTIAATDGMIIDIGSPDDLQKKLDL